MADVIRPVITATIGIDSASAAVAAHPIEEKASAKVASRDEVWRRGPTRTKQQDVERALMSQLEPDPDRCNCGCSPPSILLSNFNDRHSKAEVLALVDRAIQAEQTKQQLVELAAAGIIPPPDEWDA